MKVSDAAEKIQDKKELVSMYNTLKHDPTSIWFGSKALDISINKLYRDIYILEELIYNMELDDSYDERTRRSLYV